MEEQKVNPLFPGRHREFMCLVFVGWFTWLNVGGGIVLSYNSLCSEFADVFFS